MITRRGKKLAIVAVNTYAWEVSLVERLEGIGYKVEIKSVENVA